MQLCRDCTFTNMLMFCHYKPELAGVFEPAHVTLNCSRKKYMQLRVEAKLPQNSFEQNKTKALVNNGAATSRRPLAVSQGAGDHTLPERQLLFRRILCQSCRFGKIWHGVLLLAVVDRRSLCEFFFQIICCCASRCLKLHCCCSFLKGVASVPARITIHHKVEFLQCKFKQRTYFSTFFFQKVRFFTSHSYRGLKIHFYFFSWFPALQFTNFELRLPCARLNSFEIIK